MFVRLFNLYVDNNSPVSFSTSASVDKRNINWKIKFEQRETHSCDTITVMT